MSARPRTVLQLATRLNVGGPARHIHMLADRLGDGYRILLAAGRSPSEEGELLGVQPVVSLPLERRLSPGRDLRAVHAIRHLVVREQVDLVATHMAKAGACGRLAARTSSPRPRTVHTFHGHVLSGYFSRPSQAAFMLAERTLARWTDALVAVSPEIRDELLDLGVGRPSQWHVIPVAVDLAPFLQRRRNGGTLRTIIDLPRDALLIGVLGRLTAIKGHPTLIRALADVPGAHLAVLGDGDARDELEALARSIGIADRVHFCGWQDDVPEALADLDVVALTSRNEGTPLSLIEAGAAAKPVVAARVGGVPSVVLDGKTGLLVPAGDPAATAGALRSLSESPSLRRELGEAARAHVAAAFGWEPAVAATRALYDELLS